MDDDYAIYILTIYNRHSVKHLGYSASRGKTGERKVDTVAFLFFFQDLQKAAR